MESERNFEESFYKAPYSEGCPGCNRIEPQPEGLIIVYEDDKFRVHQDYALPIPGMMVVESKRHIKSISDFTPEELNRYSLVLRKVRDALGSIGVENATLIQEEKSSHFHAWFLPIYPWMANVTSGKLRNIQEIFDYAKGNMVTDQHISEVEKATKAIKEYMESE